MFADPTNSYKTAPTGATQAVTISGAGSAFDAYVCTGRGPTSSTYRYTVSSSHWIDLFIGRQVGKRSRYTVRYTETELVPDPINSELNVQKTSTLYVVADIGPLGTGTSWNSIEHGLGCWLYKPTDVAAKMDSVLLGNT